LKNSRDFFWLCHLFFIIFAYQFKTINKMDTHTSNDNNNPINWNGNDSNECDCCGIEENKTYFIEDTNTCEDCFEEEEKKESK